MPLNIGILAYGSLVDDAGPELEPLIVDRLQTMTPFHVEFYRSSVGRGGAPTLVPVTEGEGGSPVNATILKLERGLDLQMVLDMLWRREANRPGHYDPPPPGEQNENTLLLKEILDYEGLDVVLYVHLGANIPENKRKPMDLAKLAIESCYPASSGATKRDGISYLINTISNGIITPLTEPYKDEILRLTSTLDLNAAWRVARAAGEPDPDTDPEGWENWKEIESAKIHPAYHTMFPEIRSDTIERVRYFIEVEGPWRGTREERNVKYSHLVHDLSEIYGIDPSPTVNIVHPQEINLVGSGIFLQPREADRRRGIEAVKFGGHLSLPRGSVVTVLHEFRHAMQQLLHVRQRAVPHPEREQYGPIQGGTNEEDARGWSLSMYYLASPSRFLLGVRKKIILHLKRYD